METLAEKIERFERTTDGTVKSFNEVFPETPLKQFKPDMIVDIGEIAQPVTTRYLTVDESVVFKHSFSRVLESERV